MSEFSPNDMPDLITDRLLLRPISVADFDALFWLRTDERVNRYIDRQPPGSLEDVASWFEKMTENAANNGLFYWAICRKEQPSLIGTACLFNFSEADFKAEIGYELHPDFQKKGFAGEALRAVVGFCFDKLPVETIEAFIHEKNQPSINLIEKLGFKPDSQPADENEKGFVLFRLKR